MHVPDGFLTNRVALSLDALSGAGLFYAAHRLKMEASARIIPIMGVLSAFVFVAQMLNFPLVGGTSGHLVGGALLGMLLGPIAGVVTMASVVIAQALFLQDGGLMAVGANIFNIGAVTSFSGYAVYRLFGAPERPGKLLAVTGFLAGWASVVISSAACALELGLSGAVPLKIGLPAMTGYHALIGIVEGALTAGVLSFFARVRPDLLKREFRPRFGLADAVGTLLLVAFPLGILVFAGSSGMPDPLQALLDSAVPRNGLRESLLSPERVADLHLVLGYLGILVLCGLAFWGVRVAWTRRDRP